MISTSTDLKRELKNIVIKPLSIPPKVPEGYFQNAWSSLQQAISAIFLNQKPKTSIEILYRLVGDISIIQMEEALFKLFHNELYKKIEDRVDVLYSSVKEPEEKYLALFDSFWKEYKDQIARLRQIFLTLERSYMIKSGKCKSIWKLCMSLLDSACTGKPEILNRLLGSISALIEKERLTRPTEESQRMLKSGTEVLMELGHYKDTFESMFAEQTRAFYKNESEVQIKKGDIKGYIGYIKTRVKDERERVIAYLDLSTGPRLQSVLEFTLIKNHIGTLIGPGFVTLAEEGATLELETLYEAIKNVGEIDSLRKSWSDYLHKKGAAMLQSDKNSEEIVEKLIEFKRNMDCILEKSFESDQAFRLTLKNSFEDFLNANANRSAEYVAKYLDMYLNSDALKKIKKKSDEEIKAVIDSCMPLFKFILNKDIFEAFYLRRLCKRLLFHKLVSSECEKYLLDKLREECGTNYTRKAEAMFQDIEVTEELSKGFTKYVADAGKPLPSIQFSASVLTLGSWPFEAFIPIPLPQEISMMQDMFEKYYSLSNPKKRLHWNAPYSSATLIGVFDKEYIIEASGLQAMILLLFNERESVQNMELPGLLGVSAKAKLEKKKQILETFEAAVYALMKSKLLLADGDGKEIIKDTKFAVNKGFTSKFKKVVVTRMNKKEKAEESKETEEKVMEERKYEVDAAIMKIMKARKKCAHGDLLEALRSQLKFLFQPPAIKKRIEGLIERDYLRRDEKNSNVYLYVS